MFEGYCCELERTLTIGGSLEVVSTVTLIYFYPRTRMINLKARIERVNIEGLGKTKDSLGKINIHFNS